MELGEKVAITINALLYVIKNLGGRGDFHKVFKILYFADQKHLCKYGSLITGDSYIAMTNGPVPSMAYDILKSLRSEGLMATHKGQFEPHFKLKDKFVVEAKSAPDMEYFSDSEIECLNESLAENKDKSFSVLTRKSHDKAWEKAKKDGEMSTVEIARAGGAERQQLHYISNHLENINAVFE